MKALVIHPRFFIYGGGELLSLYVCKTLQELGYDVSIACDTFDPETAERMYGLGSTLKNCRHIQIPDFHPFFKRFMALQRLPYARKIQRLLKSEETDLVFSTQSSIFMFKGKPLYHFVYDIMDLFAYPAIPLVGDSNAHLPLGGSWVHWKAYYFILKQLRRIMMGENPRPTRFFALSMKILNDLKNSGYSNSELLFPPCPLTFKPRPKKPYVIQVTRVVPQKRLEIFLEVAKLLPEYQFYIVGRDDPSLQNFNPGYSRKLLSNLPKNVVYVESPLREVPKLLEEAKVYLYTGIEPGIGIALCQAIGAGCVPVAPSKGGGMEVLRATDLESFAFHDIESCVRNVRRAVEQDLSELSPVNLRKSAVVFSPERFQEEMKKWI